MTRDNTDLSPGSSALRIQSSLANTSGQFIPLFLMVLAQVYGVARQLEEALNQLVETERLVQRTRECWAEAEMFRLRGKLLLSMNEHTQAENHYRQALASAARQSAKFWELPPQ
jgi:predicted negative regulator of RcsB-dependent stress response